MLSHVSCSASEAVEGSILDPTFAIRHRQSQGAEVAPGVAMAAETEVLPLGILTVTSTRSSR